MMSTIRMETTHMRINPKLKKKVFITILCHDFLKEYKVGDF